MGCSNEDKILIKNLHDSKEYGAKKLTKELSEKGGAKVDCHCKIVSARDKFIVLMNWNGGLSTSGTVFKSIFLTRLMTSGEEDFERVSVLQEDTLSTACELTTLILSLSVIISKNWLVIVIYQKQQIYCRKWYLNQKLAILNAERYTRPYQRRYAIISLQCSAIWQVYISILTCPGRTALVLHN